MEPKKFENNFAKYSGCKYGVAVCNGSIAIHLALVSLGIGKGDEVIIPTFTMIASALAVVYTGAKPVFVDADKETWNIDVSKIESKISSRTKAIMPVHIFGKICDMDSIKKIFGLTVDEIEFSKLEDNDSIDKYSLVRWLSREPAPEWIYKYNFSLDTNHIVQNSRIEIFSWVREQSISITNHRYGNIGFSPVSI